MSGERGSLARRIAREQDAVLEARPDELARARAALLASLPDTSPPVRRGLVAPWAAWSAGALVLGVLLCVYLVRRPPPLTVRVDGAARPVVGRYLAASRDRALPLEFSDGSQVQVLPEGAARVTRVDSRGAWLQLEHGRARVSVRHRDDTRWQIDAGPFAVRVVGTRFELGWDPASETFELQMQEGVVVLTGPGGDARTLGAGASIRTTLQSSDADQEEAVDDPEPVRGLDEAAQGQPRPVQDVSAQRSSSGRGRPGTRRRGAEPAAGRRVEPMPGGPAVKPEADEQAATPSALERLFGEGRYADVVAEARRLGWRSTLARAQPDQLLMLGDAARLSGHHDHAQLAYGEVRRRFGRSSEAVRAAFVLGRLAQEKQGQPARAAAWYEIYLREAPRGTLAQEAEGRLLEAQLASGADESARRTAGRYLDAHPSGPHASLARRTLEGAP